MSLFFKTIASFLFIIILFPCIVAAQNNAPSCTDLHNGVFYFYPKNAKDKYTDIRDDEYLHETNTITGDTSLWRIKWISDCKYALTYVSGTDTISKAAAKFMKKHVLVFEIKGVTNDYYLFKGYIDKTTNSPIQDDTMWLNEKIKVADNQLFTNINDSRLLAAQPISDTSKYALLYVYRQGKVTLCLVDYLLYFDNNIMCIFRNNSGYVFKILKEGNFEVKSKLLKEEGTVNLNVQFGKVYYIESVIHWGFYSKLSNSQLENKIVNADEGKKNFGGIKFK